MQSFPAKRTEALPEGQEILSRVYPELRRLAAHFLRREKRGVSLQPTELVNECYLRLYQHATPDYSSRQHFFGLAARSMRQILVDRARRRGTLKRGESPMRLSLEDALLYTDEEAWQVIAIHEALKRLAASDQRLCQVVELRFFAGLGVEETAAVLGSSPSTVRREWSLARAWLHRELS